jgi:cytochrome c553
LSLQASAFAEAFFMQRPQSPSRPGLGECFLRNSLGKSARRLIRIAAAGMALCFGVTAMSPAEAAGDAAAGRNKAKRCQTCHGLDGKATIPEAPNLAAQSEIYLLKALKDYQSGARKNEMMSVIAPNLSETDIADLAAYYASLPPVAASPQ